MEGNPLLGGAGAGPNPLADMAPALGFEASAHSRIGYDGTAGGMGF